MKISIIVPCYNEESTIPCFYEEAERVRKKDFTECGVSFEYIFVDDGSTDSTLIILRELSQRDCNVRYLSFSRNFGKEAAIIAGLEASTGELVTLLDADLQDPPSMLRKMYDVIMDEGYDQVGTRRVTRKGEPLLRTFCAKAFYKIINRISYIEMVDGARDFRLMKRYVVDSILSLPEKCRYSKGIFSFVGFKTKWLAYENVERVAGNSKWTFWKLFKYAMSGIVAFSTFPLILPVVSGAIFIIASVLLLVFGLIRGEALLLLLSSVFFTGGTLLTSLGILGQYLAQAYIEIKGRPQYIVRERECHITAESEDVYVKNK